jgi:glycerate 2-kinase
MARVLLAPDKFKGTLTGAEVAASLAEGIRSRRPTATLVKVPVADGGGGSLGAFAAAGFQKTALRATDAIGRTGPAWYVRLGDEAVVELAEVAGLAGLGDARAPLTATSRGLGEVIAHALDAGCTEVLVAIGGSASTDGGLGLVQALGARVSDASGNEVGPGGAGAATAATLDLTRLHPKLAAARLEVACDVDNPLTGPDGAAAVYGPQKGADPDQVLALDAALTHWADRVAAATGRDHRDDPGAGAAGGIGFAALALLDAELRPGIDLVLDLVGFHEQLPGSDLVVTGEGALDVQTLHGKAPAGVAAAARAAGIPVVAVCGRNTLSLEQLQEAGIRTAYALTDIEPDLARCMSEGASLLETLGARIAADHLTTHATTTAGSNP